MSSSLEEMTVDLENAICDLVTEKRNQPFLRNLFSRAAGTWVSVRECAEDSREFLESYLPLRNGLSHDVMVTWLDHPEGSAGYALILFYLEDQNWSKVALFNRASLRARSDRAGKRPAKSKSPRTVRR